jgi:hypothetical protein
LAPPSQPFNETYFNQEALNSLAAILEGRGQANGALRTLLYMENAKPYNSKFNSEQMKQLGFKQTLIHSIAWISHVLTFLPLADSRVNSRDDRSFMWMMFFRVVVELLRNLASYFVESVFEG